MAFLLGEFRARPRCARRKGYIIPTRGTRDLNISVETALHLPVTAERTLPPALKPSQPRLVRQRLIDLYEREYSIVPADRPDRRRAAHGLRYQVYCVENAFENAAAHPDCMEADEFDGHAAQHLLQRLSDGAAIGTVRLILPVHSGRPGGLLDCLPFNRLARQVVPRMAEAEDVWQLVAFLLGDAAAMMSGQVLHVGGA